MPWFWTFSAMHRVNDYRWIICFLGESNTSPTKSFVRTAALDLDHDLNASRNTNDQLNDSSANLNQTQESTNGLSSSSANSTVVVKRTPSLNDSHLSRHAQGRVSTDHAPMQIYENVAGPNSLGSTPNVVKESMSTQTEARSPLRPPVLQKEGSFVRTGSGRKLPKIPAKPATTGSTPGPVVIHGTNSLPRAKTDQQDEFTSTLGASKAENRKSRPKALDFWEHMEDNSMEKSDFRYNTIHRMSIGRRMLPQTPGKPMAPSQRSQSLDRSGEMAAAITAATSVSSIHSSTYCSDADKSLNSSFSGPTSLPNQSPLVERKHSLDAQGSKGFSPGTLDRSTNNGTTVPGQPSPPSSDTRGEVEGSSDNNSPPTSVIQGCNNMDGPWNKAYDWLKSTATATANGNGTAAMKKWDSHGTMSKEFLSHHEELNSDKFHPKYAHTGSRNGLFDNGFPSLDEEVLYLRSLRRTGDGNSQSSSGGKPSDTLSDDVPVLPLIPSQKPMSRGSDKDQTPPFLPYDVLLRDLTQAKRQLLELQNLVRGISFFTIQQFHFLSTHAWDNFQRQKGVKKLMWLNKNQWRGNSSRKLAGSAENNECLKKCQMQCRETKISTTSLKFSLAAFLGQVCTPLPEDNF